MRILIIANARYKGGLSGSDAIYESFKKYWDCEFSESNMLNIDFKPFSLCYLFRIALSICRSLLDNRRYDLVYSSSDFLPDTIPAFIYKIKGNRWVAGYFLEAFKESKIHYLSQKLVKWLIRKYADMVIVTNPTMYHLFHSKKKTWINGGIDLSLAGLSDEPKIYDAVFCGRIHPTKGINELAQIWKLVREQKPNATLAVIGDGDLGVDYLKGLIGKNMGVTYFGYMDDERFKIYKQSKVVLYPTPLKYDHFSMAPVEAMACGCPMICFDNPVNIKMNPAYAYCAPTKTMFANAVPMNGLEFTNECINSVVEWAQQFDYKTQSTRVYEDICRQLTLI